MTLTESRLLAQSLCTAGLTCLGIALLLIFDDSDQ